MTRRGIIYGLATVVCLLGATAALDNTVYGQAQTLVLEDFLAKEADGFPSNWDHENQRSQSKGREADKKLAPFSACTL